MQIEELAYLHVLTRDVASSMQGVVVTQQRVEHYRIRLVDDAADEAHEIQGVTVQTTQIEFPIKSKVFKGLVVFHNISVNGSEWK